MDAVRMRREATRRAVARNPVALVLRRRIEQDDGAGGTKEVEVDLPPQTMRIYLLPGVRNLAQEGGQIQIARPGLLAFHDADVQKGDKFEYDGRQYSIDRVQPIRLLGHIVSLQCELAEVG